MSLPDAHLGAHLGEENMGPSCPPLGLYFLYLASPPSLLLVQHVRLMLTSGPLNWLFSAEISWNVFFSFLVLVIKPKDYS